MRLLTYQTAEGPAAAIQVHDALVPASAKFANSLTGRGQPIVLTAPHAEYVDYEAELALVVGRPAKHVAAEDALSYLAGAMPFNDVSARDLQLQNPCGRAAKRSIPSRPAVPPSRRSMRSTIWPRSACAPA
jgi:2-keto-4-pentenoate hydratase/2-oxohepta-3-ene-1,7-dioic acid hydratase in catechol pathway